jgi:hypothetical protein
MADALGMDEDQLNRMTPEELIDYFKERLKDQDGRHDGGSKWIGTGGTSPVGHSGYHPGGMRVGGCRATSPPSRWPWSGATRIIPCPVRSPRPWWAKPSNGCATWYPPAPRTRSTSTRASTAP